jgi:DinB superfamily
METIKLRSLSVAVFGVFLLAAPRPVSAQGSARDALAGNWDEIARKLVAVAQEFPEEKYDFRPTPEVRTFAQQLLHVAFWNQYLAKKARGQNPDGKLNELPRAQYKTKAAVVKVVRSSFDEAGAVLKSMTDEEALKGLALWDGFTEHSGEHYGQLVMYYRLNGLVPPESRPAK